MGQNIELNTPEATAQEIAEKALEFADLELKSLEGIKIETPEVLHYYEGQLTEIKTRIKEIEIERKKFTDPLNSVVKRINNVFRTPRERLKVLEKVLKEKLLEYNRELQRKKMERERELQKKQEAERKRLEAKIKRAENSGKESRVNQLRFEADNLPEHIEVKAEAKVKGIRKLWRGKVSNPNEVKENAEQLYEMGLLVPDSEAINSFARATKGKVVLKGISVWEEEILAGRTT